MRDFKGMKRQRGRSRGGGGQGKPQQQNANRAFESNGPDGVKVRGNAQHIFEKYQQLARDASSSGDRVLAENYLQHAEHYFRVIRAVQPNRPIADIIGRETFASGFDIDFEDENGVPIEAEAPSEPEAAEEGDQRRQEPRQDRYEGRDRQRDDRQRDERPRDRDDRPRDDRPRDRDRSFSRDDRPRDDRPRDDRPREDRFRDDRPREERPREERPRDDRPRDDRARDERPRDDRPREDRPRDERSRRERPPRRDERPSDPMAVVEPQATPLTTAEPTEQARMLRSQDGGLSEAPAFLQPREPRPEAAADETSKARPKRRRAPTSFKEEGGTTAPEAEEA